MENVKFNAYRFLGIVKGLRGEMRHIVKYNIPTPCLAKAKHGILVIRSWYISVTNPRDTPSVGPDR